MVKRVPNKRHASEASRSNLSRRFVEKIYQRQACAPRDVVQTNVRCDCGDCADVCARSCQALGEARKIFGEFNQFSIPDIRQHSGDIGVCDEQSGNQALCGVGLNN
jgi:hypothetical protein